jgi:hypothetical protein
MAKDEKGEQPLFLARTHPLEGPAIHINLEGTEQSDGKRGDRAVLSSSVHRALLL